MNEHLPAVLSPSRGASPSHTGHNSRPHFPLPVSPVGSIDSVEPDIVFVDLDGTLIATDLLVESLLQIAKLHPSSLPRIVAAGLRNRIDLKQQVAALVQPNPELLPYRPEVLAFLREQKALGRTIVLATASHVDWATAVARHLGIFDAVLASTDTRNLKGHEKLKAISEFCRQAGHEQFAYLGDARADMPIWQEAARAYVVAPSHRLRTKLPQLGVQAKVLANAPNPWLAILAAIRPHQWAKNLLLFVPIFLSHMVTLPGIISALLAFVTFCLAASSVYVLNDLLDVDADRQHPTKRKRPFASGRLDVAWGVPLSALMMGAAFTVAFVTLPWSFTAWLGVYAVTTMLYSFWLKRLVVIDVMVLAGLYTLRIMAGMMATASPMSEWLLCLSLFLFTSLAFAKRYAELGRLTDQDQHGAAGRGYVAADLGIIESLGPASGYLAVLVLALYINSNAMRSLYSNAWALWMVCPLFMYWITRVWFLAKRRQLSEDPVVFALKDTVSRIVGVGVLVLVLLASFG